jgi:hypothetical protein
VSENVNLKRRVTTVENRTRPAVQTTTTFGVNLAATGRPPVFAGSVTFQSAVLRPHTAVTLDQIQVDVEVGSPQFSFTVFVDGVNVASVTVPADTEHLKYRLPTTVLLSPTQTLTISSTAMPSTIGFVTVQLIGRSQTVVNQTVPLRFEVT